MSQKNKQNIIPNSDFSHFYAGAIGGTIGALCTCPLEVIKTKQQSKFATRNLSTPNMASQSSSGAAISKRSW